jgi:Histidine kinase-, DNA gyrase B-, and HSP90-like ATPase
MANIIDTPVSTDWAEITPQVNAEAEFLEIASDFGNPLEIVREAISNSIDAGACSIKIAFSVEEVDGAQTLVITVEDNGNGMTKPVLERDFWGLGFSGSRDDKTKIGEKGHGTKIYLRSEEVRVLTHSAEGAYESVCERPMRALTRRNPHQPKIRSVEPSQEHPGTSIRVYGYNQNERSAFVQNVVKDYILWFTKFGSIETELGVDLLKDLKLELKCLDVDQFETIPFGHYFPPENKDIEKLFEKYGSSAADLFVRRYVLKGERLKELPEVTYEGVISVEGDQVKRQYNPLIGERRRRDTGRYRVADRYGLWLCKDFIPVQRINDWIVGFGTGSNSFTLLHGFVNCQRLKLTANRGSIANTDPKVLEELKKAVQTHLDDINGDLNKSGIYTLFQWQNEERTLTQERDDFSSRTKTFSTRKIAKLDGQTFLEPRNESELFGLFMRIWTLRPDLFDFEPLDYNTSRGIDIVARNKTDNKISESSYWYVELKHLLRETLDHGFKYLRWIVCWDFDKAINPASEFAAVQESDVRVLESSKTPEGHTVHFLNSKTSAVKIQVVRLKQLLKERLGMEFGDQS